MRLTIAALIACFSLFAQSQDWLNMGVQAFKAGRYAEAETDFQNAVASQPNSVTPLIYLGSCRMQQWVPGASTPANTTTLQNARQAFQQALQLEPNNLIALNSLASMAYNFAASKDPFEKPQFLDEAKAWYEKVIAVDPRDKSAYYSLGVIAWSKYYPALGTARRQLGMKPQDPGPLTDPSLRQTLRTQYLPVINEGIEDLEKAMAIDPNYDDAMAYTNLLLRERGDLWDTKEECARDVASADTWVAKAIKTKAAKAQAAPPPPPPGSVERTIRVGAPVQTANLVRKVDPVYPPLAVQARVQGTVTFQATIDKTGNVTNLQLVSGHPLLIPSATEAVKKWQYRPTLLNGEPVAVITQLDVNFTLTQ
jgi:TonB family protein